MAISRAAPLHFICRVLIKFPLQVEYSTVMTVKYPYNTGF